MFLLLLVAVNAAFARTRSEIAWSYARTCYYRISAERTADGLTGLPRPPIGRVLIAIAPSISCSIHSNLSVRVEFDCRVARIANRSMVCRQTWQSMPRSLELVACACPINGLVLDGPTGL